MRRLLPVLGVVALAALGGCQSQKSRGIAASLAAADRALAANPADVSALRERGHTKEFAGDYAGARADYDRYEAINPADLNGLLDRGRVKDKLGDFAGAIADFDRYMELNPTGEGRLVAFHADPEPPNHDVRLARAYAVAGIAVAAATDALANNPNDVATLAARGRARSARGQSWNGAENFDAAIGDFDRAIALTPADGALFRDRALARYIGRDKNGLFVSYFTKEWKARDERMIAADLERAIALNPRDAKAYLYRGFFKRALQGAKEEPARNAAMKRRTPVPEPTDHLAALADIDRAIEIDPHDADALYNRAVIQFRQKDYKAALADLDRVLAAAPEYFQALNARARVKREAGDEDGVQADIKLGGWPASNLWFRDPELLKPFMEK